MPAAKPLSEAKLAALEKLKAADSSPAAEAFKFPPKPAGPSPNRFQQKARRAILESLVQRKFEGLRLYRSFPGMEGFHTGRQKWRVASGSNRSGKTVGVAVEAVRAWTGCDPYGKYRPTNGFCLVVGQDEDHLSQLWAKISKPGAFWVIPDEHTKMLRSVRSDPNNPLVLDPYDDAYREKWKEAPPLLPERMIRRVAMDNAAKEVPRFVTTENGWRSMWRPGGGKAARGEHYDLVLFDEHLTNEDFYYEAVRGLVDIGSNYKSVGIWSATPQRQNFLMWDLCEAARNGDVDVAQFFYDIERNFVISAGERKTFHNLLPEERRLVQYYGQHAIQGWRHYPEFSPAGVHGCEPFEIPDNWTRFFALDPAVNGCGTIFVAVDPDEQHVWFYDEMLLPEKAGAKMWAAEMAKRPDARKFHAWVIDEHAGRQSGIAGGDSAAQQYFDALAERGIYPEVRGPRDGFFPGTGDTEARRQALRNLLWVRDAGTYAGTSIFQILRGQLPGLEKQITKSQRDQKNPGKRMKGRFDLLDAAEYIAHYGPTYVPVAEKQVVSPVVEAFLRKKSKATQTSTIGPGMEMRT